MSEPDLEVALGEGMTFEGLLVLPKPARIDGRVGGAVIAGTSVWVGVTGVVEADLEADAIVIEGSVQGDLRARTSIELGPGAVVTGDLLGPRLTMADGAQLNGHCQCGDPSAVLAEVLGERPSDPASAAP
jgi:cytoskeletal protein CcmA (bactofilin family)